MKYKEKFNTNDIVLITGASSGIGAKTAEYLALKGLKILLVARREEKLLEVCERIKKHQGDARYYVADLTNENDRNNLFLKLNNQNLIPDILINNAGFAWYGYYYDMPWEIGKELIAVNTEAVAHLTRIFLPSMLAKKHGHIINIGSVAGKLPEQGIALYSASKAFLDAFTTSVYRDLRGSQVNISVVRAGPIKTEFFETARKLDNGSDVPAEKIATSVESVAKGIWRLINHPQKVVYIPYYLVISPLLEVFFSKIIDFVGPLLLRKNSKHA
ncbi:MAG: short-chain dehydrogenase/reductase SDR [Chloroflexi bacterium]|nr:MAG: short-chain dehydrogenase/reductase SDR [Chloroflexota bacterium]